MSNKIEQIIDGCKITITVERLTEPKAEPKQKEPIKLYCVKSYKYFLTKGNQYIFDGAKIKYDNVTGATWNDYADWKKNNHNLADCLFPLVKRPAKVGEWVLVVKSRACDRYGYYKNGDVFKCVKDDYGAGDAIIVDCKRWVPAYGNTTTQLLDSEYLVLDGYKVTPKPNARKPKLPNCKSKKPRLRRKSKR